MLCTFKNEQTDFSCIDHRNFVCFSLWAFMNFDLRSRYTPVLHFVQSFAPHALFHKAFLLTDFRTSSRLLCKRFSLERRWSSRTFRYGYLVTTSPQSPTPPSTAAPFRLAHRLRVLSALMVWRAVCTRPGNVFTAAFWSAITSNSNFMQASCSLQSELGPSFVIRSSSRIRFTLFSAIVVRV